MDTCPSEKKIAKLKMLATVPLSGISDCCGKHCNENRDLTLHPEGTRRSVRPSVLGVHVASKQKELAG